MAISVSLTTSSPNVSGDFVVTATFSESVTGFDSSDVIVTGGTCGSVTAVSGSVYNFTITPTGVSSVTVKINSSSALGTVTGDPLTASFNTPTGLEFDAAGNMYVVDFGNNKIRKITPAGVVSDFVSITNPIGLVKDSSGNFYVNSGTTIKKVTPAGVVSDFATIPNAINAMTIDSQNNLYLADSTNRRIKKVTSAGTVSDVVTLTSPNTPIGVTTDSSNNLYWTVSSIQGQVIKKMTPAPSSVTTTLAGSATVGSTDATGASASFNSPAGLGCDSSGNIYVADLGNNKIRKITPAGVVTTLSSNITIGSKSEITFDASGNLYTTNSLGSVVYKVNSGGSSSTFAGNGSSGSSNGSFAGNAESNLLSSTYTAPVVAPSAPVLSPTATHSSIDLSWTASSGTSPITYSVFKSSDNVNWNSLASGLNVLVYSDSTAVAGTTYYYKVVSHNSGGDATSNIVNSVVPVPYHVTYHSNGASGVAPVDSGVYYSGDSVTISGSGTLSKTNYNFSGWSLSPNGSIINTLTISSSDVDLYAIFVEKAKYFIYYSGNGYNVSVPPSQHYEGSEFNLVTSISRRGYNFSGWATADNYPTSGSVYQAEGSFTMPSSDVNMYAYWVAITPAKIYYHKNDGTNTTSVDNTDYYDLDTATIMSNSPRDGYNFLSWNTAANGSGTSYNYNDVITMSSSDVHLYAQWEEIRYSVIYNSNGSGAVGVITDSNTYKSGDSVTIKPGTGLTRNETEFNRYWKFKGWNTAYDGTGISYSENEQIQFPENANLTLYAVWARVFRVIYDANNADWITAEHTELASFQDSNMYEPGDDCVIMQPPTNMNNFNKDFFTWNSTKNPSLDNWSDAADYTPGETIVFPGVKGESGSDITLYAVWGNNDPIANDATLMINPGDPVYIYDNEKPGHIGVSVYSNLKDIFVGSGSGVSPYTADYNYVNINGTRSDVLDPRSSDNITNGEGILVSFNNFTTGKSFWHKSLVNTAAAIRDMLSVDSDGFLGSFEIKNYSVYVMRDIEPDTYRVIGLSIYPSSSSSSPDVGISAIINPLYTKINDSDVIVPGLGVLSLEVTTPGGIIKNEMTIKHPPGAVNWRLVYSNPNKTFTLYPYGISVKIPQTVAWQYDNTTTRLSFNGMPTNPSDLAKVTGRFKFVASANLFSDQDILMYGDSLSTIVTDWIYPTDSATTIENKIKYGPAATSYAAHHPLQPDLFQNLYVLGSVGSGDLRISNGSKSMSVLRVQWDDINPITGQHDPSLKGFYTEQGVYIGYQRNEKVVFGDIPVNEGAVGSIYLGGYVQSALISNGLKTRISIPNDFSGTVVNTQKTTTKGELRSLYSWIKNIYPVDSINYSSTTLKVGDFLPSSSKFLSGCTIVEIQNSPGDLDGDVIIVEEGSKIISNIPDEKLMNIKVGDIVSQGQQPVKVVEVGADYVVLNAPIFSGGGTQTLQLSSISAYSFATNLDITLTSYSVFYDSNGGAGSIADSASYVVGEFITIKSHTGMSRSGYTFDHWNTAADGSGTNYYENQIIQASDSNLTLYAVWTEGQQSQALSLQVKKKFINNRNIDETKILFNNDAYFRALKSDGSEKEVFKVNAQNKIQFADEIVVPAASIDSAMVNKGQLTSAVAAEQSRAVAAEASVAASIAAEASRAGAAESSISAAAAAAVAAEESRAMAAEGSLSSDLAAEASRAGIAESSLQSQINAIDNGSSASTVAEESRAMAAEASLAADIAVEQSRATAAEGSLSSDLAAEASRSGVAEGSIQSQINSIISNTNPSALDSLTEIVAAFEGADTATTTAINNLSASAAADLAAEVSRAGAAEASLAAAITAEASRAGAAEGSLSSDLAVEVSRAQAAEGSLSAAIAAEASRAMAAESVLTSDLAAEVSRAGIAEASIAASIAAEESRAMTAEGSLSSDLAAEVSRAGAAEASLAVDIAAEQSRATAAEGVLTSDLAAEASRAGIAEASVAASVAAEVSRAMAAEGVLTSDLAAEVSRATAAEGSLQSQINSIISNTDPAALDSMTEIVAAFEAADGNLSTTITNLASSVAADLAVEVSRAQAAEGSLSAAIAAEASRAGAAESALDSRVTSLEAIVNEKEKFVLTSQDISNGYIELSRVAAVKSTFITADRLPIHEGSDYTISVVNGKTRITFIGSMIGSGFEVLVADDVVLVEYSY